MDRETIFALATAPGRAGIAIIRVSGPGSAAAFRHLTGREVPEPRVATRVWLQDDSGDRLDDGLALWFPRPASVTGEDVVEFHVHGSRAVVAEVLDVLTRRPGLRPAEPGEFTRRSFENGKMDLTAAEGLADLVAAETAAQRRQALRQMGGALAHLYEGWRSELVQCLAHLEAAIDFADEDLPNDVERDVDSVIDALAIKISRHLNDGRRGERLREGIHIVIVGAPNAGKSSLLNRLAGTEAAIVSATAGTTRDVIEVHLDLGGYPVVLADTAGLRDAEGEIEAEGVRRAVARAAAADLRLAVFDAGRLPDLDEETLRLVDDNTVIVINKTDLRPGVTTVVVDGRTAFGVSALHGDGVESLLAELQRIVAERWSMTDGPVPTRTRHRAALMDCVSALERARGAEMPDLKAEDVRLAARALGRITGRVEVEELLDVIFRDFCIGK
ncbi:MAG: tRNA uridine-5-carboxymethylaminomethyl(34) synthesis GTPase MnmE [Alphaproteobacteria bacterium]